MCAEELVPRVVRFLCSCHACQTTNRFLARADRSPAAVPASGVDQPEGMNPRQGSLL
jgi:hypothetical protein